MALTAARIKECFRYQDGKLFWLERPREHFASRWAYLVWNKAHAGQEAGCVGFKSTKCPRWRIGVDDAIYFRAILVWALFNGEIKKGLDHKNRNSLDDHIENLRPATKQQNAANTGLSSQNTSGFKGVHWCKRSRKWIARIHVNQKGKHIGSFDNPETAGEAYMNEAQKCFGEFACGSG